MLDLPLTDVIMESRLVAFEKRMIDCVDKRAQSGPLWPGNRDRIETHGHRASDKMVLDKAPLQNARTHHYRFMDTGSFFMNSNRSQNAEIQQQEGIDALLSLEEVMNLLGIGRTLLYKQMSNGELPWVQIGSTRHIRRADLIDFIERNRKGGRRVA